MDFTPYAAKAIIEHELDGTDLNFYLTFSSAMDLSSTPDLTDFTIDIDGAEVNPDSMSWLDDFTLLMTCEDTADLPDRVLVSYAGPDNRLITIGGKQWEPWADIVSQSLSGVYPPNGMPQRANVLFDEAIQSIGTGFNIAFFASQRYTFYTQYTAPADGNEFSASFFIKAGTYTINILCRKLPSCGIFDLYVDDAVLISGIDLYRSAGLGNVVLTYTGNVIATSGYHKLAIRTNGKNASSTGYDITLTKLWLHPATDPARA